MEEAAPVAAASAAARTEAGAHERALRVIGRWMDDPEAARTCSCSSRTARTSSGSTYAGQAGSHHTLAEFTRDDIEGLVAQGPTLRGVPKPR